MARRRTAHIMATFLDARLLVWLLAITFATGIPLLFWFQADAAAHAGDLPHPAGTALRAAHAAATALLVAGAATHLVVRVTRTHAPPRGVLTGGLVFLSVGLAATTGALIAQTGAADRLLDWTGLGAFGEGAVLWAGVVHAAYTTILVLVTMYLHVAKWGWGHVFASPRQAVAALAATGLLAAALGQSRPGDGSLWRGATWIAAPPVPVLWAWTLVLAVAVIAGHRSLARRHQAGFAAGGRHNDDAPPH